MAGQTKTCTIVKSSAAATPSGSAAIIAAHGIDSIASLCITSPTAKSGWVKIAALATAMLIALLPIETQNWNTSGLMVPSSTSGSFPADQPSPPQGDDFARHVFLLSSITKYIVRRAARRTKCVRAPKMLEPPKSMAAPNAPTHPVSLPLPAPRSLSATESTPSSASTHTATPMKNVPQFHTSCRSSASFRA